MTMTPPAPVDPRNEPARFALTAAWALLLAPLVAHGLWRPLVDALADGQGGDALWLSLASLVVGAVVIVGHGVRPGASAWIAGGSAVVAVGLALVVGDTGAQMACAAASLVAVSACLGLAFPAMLRRSPSGFEEFARRRWWITAIAALLALVAVVQTTRLSTFIGDVEREECQALPMLPEFTHHSCLTAYMQGAVLAERGVENLYDAEWWPDLSKSATSAREAEAYAPFSMDAYAYPPPFLLVSSAFARVSGDTYAGQRALWYGLTGLLVILGIFWAGGWVGEQDGPAGGRLLTFSLFLWVAPGAMLGTQVGNAQLPVMVAAVLAMIALDRGQRTLGAGLLSFVILSKLSPALLGITLLIQRRWADAAATAGFGVLWSLLALVIYGPEPFVAFLTYELPRLSSGEALAFFTNSPLEIAVNAAPFGIPHKLELLGVSFADVWEADRLVGRLFSVAAVILAALAGRAGSEQRGIGLSLWLAVLSLGALNSPYSPPYTLTTLFWMIMAWPTGARPGWQSAAVALCLMGLIFIDPSDVTRLVTIILVQQALILGLIIAVILRAPSRAAQG